MPVPKGESRREADVIVVGAGPGGTTLAYLLARSGVDVTLIERERDLERTFRGYLFQPFVLKTFDAMGILDDVLELEHSVVEAPSLVVYDRVVSPFNFESYDPPYDRALLMEQPPLLQLLIERATAYDGFEYRNGTTVEDLTVEGGRVVGIEATDRATSEAIELRSKLVVGADGRYSTVRKAAGIDPGLFESSIELVWFKLPADAVTDGALGRINEAGVLLYFGLGGGEAQLGLLVEKGAYASVRSAGLKALYDRITAIDPSLDGVVQENVTDFRDCTLLHIEPGISDRWIDDGLLLLGDAAHVASPVGGQGNGLAIGDAVVAHSVILESIPGSDAALPVERLRRYEQTRRPTVEGILRLQRRGEKVISAFVRHRDLVPIPVALQRPVFGWLATLLLDSPLSDRLQDRFAWGSWEPVDTAHFIDSR